jgi:hypothetical protein
VHLSTTEYSAPDAVIAEPIESGGCVERATIIAVVATAPFGSPALQHAVALANRRGAVVIAAAVTVRSQHGDIAYPAALPGVISVMAIGPDGTRPASCRRTGPRWPRPAPT